MQETLTYVLPLLLWGALTGILNLIFTRKSQIEAWVSANPRIAAWAKFLRAIGFDPWAAHAWLVLLVKKRLPEAQQANSPIAKLEERKAEATRRDDEPPSAGGTGPWVDVDAKTPPSLPGVHRLVAIGWMVLLLPSCGGWKPVVRSVNDIAKDLCIQHFGAKSKLSIDDVAKQFCETRDDLSPWLDAILAAKREAAPVAEARKP